MNMRKKDMQIRQFEQKTQTDEDLESMVPPLWSRFTIQLMVGVLVVLALIAAGVMVWG
ncbi:hypothetical protein [Rhizobium sp. L1K21]|uniref:hypothetical protein n=1 Tax=Rhizobium sp. L1K21 TaxID=2954933 RepID=UPI0020927B01|nr:hypothetical protein [Rhizobium sp. L1K21]MCO6184669.1 hypothetical protein [Rhizobium sp. L1K21]